MPSPASPTPDPKYAWRDVARAAPVKRPVPDRLADYREIYATFDAATAQAQASRCLQCPHPLCAEACPLANRIPEWMALAARGEFLEAAAVSRTTSNLPEICARVCPQEKLCEGACFLGGRTEAVAIGGIERFLHEYAFAHDAVKIVRPPPNGCRVAVVGSGPAGLAAADELANLGYAVTVFESLPVAGGLLVHGIPGFKLEKNVVQRRVDLLAASGITFRLGVQVGHDLSFASLQRDYDAIFLGIGAQRARPLDVPGAGLAGVVAALPFLVHYNAAAAPGEAPPALAAAGRRVVVLGGGDTAMDCLRTALRAGATSALCLYRRDLANMPGSRKEYANALEEGAAFQFLTRPLELVADEAGRVAAVRCERMALGEPDASGRRTPRPVAGSAFTVAADLVLVAYGFDPVAFPADTDLGRLATTEWGGFVVNRDQMTSLPGVFAGGDTVRGPSLVVQAVRDARRAAQGIDRYVARQRR